MAEPTRLYSQQGTWVDVTTPSMVRELELAGWTRTPPALVQPALDVAAVTPVTQPKRGRPKKAQ
jgi:hypothetical protein